MSLPISFCLISKAAIEGGPAYDKLRDATRYNLACGHWSQGGCSHEPPCPTPTDEQIEALNAKLEIDCADVKRGSFGPPPGPEGQPGA